MDLTLSAGRWQVPLPLFGQAGPLLPSHYVFKTFVNSWVVILIGTISGSTMLFLRLTSVFMLFLGHACPYSSVARLETRCVMPVPVLSLFGLAVAICVPLWILVFFFLVLWRITLEPWWVLHCRLLIVIQWLLQYSAIPGAGKNFLLSSSFSQCLNDLI